MASTAKTCPCPGEAPMTNGAATNGTTSFAGAATTNGVPKAGAATSKISVVLGAQWGDEGKGKLVDLLAVNADMVCRCQGRREMGTMEGPLPVMAAVAVRKKVVSIGHFCLESLQFFLYLY